MAKFKKGQSGNPAGRPPSARTARKVNDFIRDDDVQAVVAKVVELAREGDMQAAAMVLDRVLPKLKPMADVEEAAGLAEAVQSARLRAMRNGGMSLESIVVLTGVAEPVVAPQAAATAVHAPVPPPAAPVLAATSAATLALRHAMQADDSEPGHAVTDYDPYN